MHAAPIFLELIGGQLVLGHMGTVGVTSGASLHDAPRVDRRLRILHVTDVVHAVAVYAIRHRRIPSGQALAVDARHILR